MEASNLNQENPFSNLDDCLDLDRKTSRNSKKFITNMMKGSLLSGADKVLMAQRSPRNLFRFDLEPCQECDKNGSGKSPMPQSSHSSSLIKAATDYVDVSRMVDSPSGGYNEFPLNILGPLAILLIKFFGFQMNLFVRFFILPIWFAYFSFMFILFPFQTLSGIRYCLRKMILGLWASVYLSLTSFIYERIETQKSLLKMGVRFCWAFLSAIHVCFILVGMLLSGFMIGGFMMKHLVEKPIQARETEF